MAHEYTVNQVDMVGVADAIREKGQTSERLVFPGGFEDAIRAIRTGVELNFEIVGGTSKPSSPKENTIWVNTSTTITGWAFSAEEPDSPANGVVWIKTIESSSIKFNAIKEDNVLLIKLASATQFIGNALSNVDAAIYQNGTWKELTSDLYVLKNGIINSAMGNYVNASSTSFSDGQIVSNSYNLSTGNHGHFANKVTIGDGDKTLRFHIGSANIYGGNLFCVGLSSSGMQSGSYSGNASKFVAFKIISVAGEQWANVDVSAITGAYYVAIASVAVFTIDEIVLTEEVFA